MRHAPTQGRESRLDLGRGRRRLEKWKSQAPFSSSPLFEQRLAQGGLTETELLALLSETVDASSLGGGTAWADEIAGAFTDPGAVDLPPYPEKLSERPEARFLELIRPLMSRFVSRLREAIVPLAASSSNAPFNPDTVVEILFAPLPGALLGLLLRTVALELNVARLQGLLPGHTAEERLESFIRRIQRPEIALALFAEYPVLARLLVNCLENWRAGSVAFLERWCADWRAICATFSPAQQPGPLLSIQGNAGDSHRGGQSVIIARCHSGFQVVYKPKSMKADQHFQELLGWLNHQGLAAPFRQLAILDRGDYGWE